MVKLNGSRRRYYRRSRSHGKPRRGIASRIVFFILFLGIFFSLMNLMVIQGYLVRSESMNPLIPPGSRVLSSPIPFGSPLPFMNKSFPALREPRRGELVLITPPGLEPMKWHGKILDSVLRFITLQRISLDPTLKKEWESRRVIKRVAALPGDTIRIRNYRVEIKAAGTSRFQGEELMTPGLSPLMPDLPPGWDEDLPFHGDLSETLIPPGYIFVLSDARGVGLDSLVWGVLPMDSLRATLLLRYWPWPPRLL
jgi:signal peptidase I